MQRRSLAPQSAATAKHGYTLLGGATAWRRKATAWPGTAMPCAARQGKGTAKRGHALQSNGLARQGPAEPGNGDTGRTTEWYVVEIQL